MADTKITALAAITTVDPAADVLPIVDVSDTSMAASGTTKKITSNQILGAGGTATLASATITGDLTVDTSTLKVDSANNRVGIGTASPGYLLDVQAATAVANILSTTGTNTAYLQISNTGGYFYLGRENSAGTTFAAPAYSAVLYAGGAYPLVTTVNGGERYRIASDGVATWSNVGGVAGTAMTLNSTGLGVGGSPNYGFELTKTSPTIAATSNSTTGYSSLRLRNTATSGRDYEISLGGSGTGAVAAGNLYIYDNTAAAVRFLLDTSGNVGVGVTPKSWLSSYKAIQIGYSTSLSSTTGTDFAGLSSNAYVDSVDSRWERIVSGYATQYYQNAGDGQHIWRIAGTAAADTAITWTNAMTLSAAGSLVLGAAAVATTATDGFLYIPGCAGTPTGTPTSQTGRVPLVVDTTNNKLYFYSGGSWVAAN